MLTRNWKNVCRVGSCVVYLSAALLCGPITPVASTVACVCFLWTFFVVPYWLVKEITDR